MDVVEQAILAHDDGWRDWDAEVRFSGSPEEPLDFRDVKRSDQDRIWGRSIDEAARLGALAQAMIASHFIALRTGVSRHIASGHIASGNRDQEEGLTQDAREQDFLHTYESQVAAWMSGLDPRAFSKGVVALKWFDSLSLWLCCADRSESWDAQDHLGKRIVFEPAGVSHSADSRAEQHHFRVRPWPFRHHELTVKTCARYWCRRSPQATPENEYQLSWHLRAN